MPGSPRTGPGVLVVGSANRDYVVRLPAAVRPGETVLARSAEYRSGGKGANQAMAAARHGAPTWLTACVGDDPDGRAVVTALREGGVDVGLVGVVDEPTGLAVVMVDDAGENSIVVVPGANHTLTPDRVRGALASVADRVAVVIVQAEVTADALTAAVEAAAERGLRCTLNLAPFHTLPASVLALADPLVVNEVEASALAGAELTAAQAAHRLAPLARSVVVTAGAAGAYCTSGGNVDHVPGLPVGAVVDTTGAGDAFIGALGAALARGEELVAAVEHGVRAGAHAVTFMGAQPA